MAYDFYKSNFGGKQDKNTGKIVSSTPSKPSTTAKALSSALSKSGGSGGKSSGKSSGSAYSEHVSWFGSPEKYASAIQSAKSSGKALSDPNAAAAFEKDNPQLFGGIVPGGGGGSPAPALNYSSGATGGGATSTGSIGNNSAALITALKNIGSQFGSTPAAGQAALNTQANEARNAFIQAGGNISDIPTNLWGSDPSQGFQTGQGAFMGAPSYGSDLAVGGMPVANAGLTQGPANTAEAVEMGMIVPQSADWFNVLPQEAQEYFRAAGGKNEDLSNIFAANFQDGKFNYGGIQQQVIDYVNQNMPMQPVEIPIQEQIAPYLSELQNIIQGVDYETAPILMNYYNQTMDMINSTEASLMKQLEEMGQGIDPATQAALASLKETVGQQREYLKEEMGARNLLQSGIYLKEMDERINRGELSETQKLLGQRLSDIQNQINNAILSFGNARIQASSSYGLEAARLAESTAQRRQQATSNLTNAMMKALELSQQKQSDAANLEWEREKAMLPYQYVNATTQYTHGTPSAGDLLTQSRWETEWPWKQKQYQYELGKPYYKPSSGGTKTSDADTRRLNLADAQADIWNNLNSGKSIQEVEAGIVAEAGKYTRQGLNVNDLIDYAWYASTGATKPKAQGNDSADALLQALRQSGILQ